MTGRADWRRPEPLSYIKAVKLGFQNMFDFSGRARSAAFWKFLLFWLLVNILLLAIWTQVIGPNAHTAMVPQPNGTSEEAVVHVTYTSGWAGTIFNLICLIPILSLSFRRLHDVNRRGWWIFVPALWFIVVMGATAVAIFGPTELWRAFRGGYALYYKFDTASPSTALFIVILAPAVYVLLLLAGRGTRGPNRFGDDPLIRHNSPNR